MDKKEYLNNMNQGEINYIWGKHWEVNLDEQSRTDFRQYFKNPVFKDGYLIHKKYIKNKEYKNILEIGGGSGRYGIQFAIDFPLSQILITDITTESLKLIRCVAERLKLKNISVKIESVIDLSFPDNSFDLVICNATIQYLKNYDKAISEMIRVLKPGGRLLLSVINFWNLPTTIQRKLAGKNYVHGYEKAFSRRELKEIMARNKMRIVALDGYAAGYGVYRLKYFVHKIFEFLGRFTNLVVKAIDAISGRFFSKFFGFEILIVVEKQNESNL